MSSQKRVLRNRQEMSGSLSMALCMLTVSMWLMLSMIRGGERGRGGLGDANSANPKLENNEDALLRRCGFTSSTKMNGNASDSVDVIGPFSTCWLLLFVDLFVSVLFMLGVIAVAALGILHLTGRSTCSFEPHKPMVCLQCGRIYVGIQILISFGVIEIAGYLEMEFGRLHKVPSAHCEKKSFEKTCWSISQFTELLSEPETQGSLWNI